MTSPAAKMPGAAVRYSASTTMRPRSSRLDPGRLEVELLGVAAAPGGEEDLVGCQRVARQRARRASPPSTRATLARGAPRSKAHAHVREAGAQLLGGLAVEEGHEPLGPVDERDAHAEGREDRGVLAAHRSTADDDQAGGMRSMPRMVSESWTSGSSKGTSGGRNGPRAGGDEDDAAAQEPRCRRTRGGPRRRRRGAGRAPPARARCRDARGWRARHSPASSDTDGRAGAQPVEREVRCQVEADAVDLAAPVAGQVERRLAQRLGGQPAAVDGRAAGPLLALDERHALAEVGRLGGALLAGRSGADDDEVEIRFAHAVPSWRAATLPASQAQVTESTPPRWHNSRGRHAASLRGRRTKEGDARHATAAAPVRRPPRRPACRPGRSRGRSSASDSWPPSSGGRCRPPRDGRRGPHLRRPLRLERPAASHGRAGRRRAAAASPRPASASSSSPARTTSTTAARSTAPSTSRP